MDVSARWAAGCCEAGADRQPLEFSERCAAVEKARAEIRGDAIVNQMVGLTLSGNPARTCEQGTAERADLTRWHTCASES